MAAPAAAGADQHVVLEAEQEGVAAEDTAAQAGGEEAQLVEAVGQGDLPGVLSAPPQQAPVPVAVEEKRARNTPVANGKARRACCIIA